MKILTEPIGSIPRPKYLIDAMNAFASNEINENELSKLFDEALKDTIKRFEETGSPVITDGEQTKPSFATYPIAGLKNLAPDGVVIPFADGHTRQLPKITSGPFHYQTYANRKSLNSGAYNVQVDFTEARLALKLDPGTGLLKTFIDLNNKVLSRFTEEERKRIGVHSCPGGDHDSTHSADISYADLLPLLFELQAGNFYLEYAGEKDKRSVLTSIKENMRLSQRVFLGVTNVLDPRVETASEIFDTILEAAEIIPLDQLGTTDDCGFSPFADDLSTSRDTAFAKIRARVEGTALAELKLNSKKTYSF